MRKSFSYLEPHLRLDRREAGGLKKGGMSGTQMLFDGRPE